MTILVFHISYGPLTMYRASQKKLSFRICSEMPKMPKFAQNCPKWPEMPKMLRIKKKIAQNGPKCPVLPRLVFWYALLKNSERNFLLGRPVYPTHSSSPYLMQPQHCHACPVTWTKQYHTPTHIKCRFAKFLTVTTPSTQIPILYSNYVTKIWVKFPPIYLQLISYIELIQATLFTDNNISPRTRQHRPARPGVGLFRDSSIHLPLFKSWQPSSQFRLCLHQADTE